MEAPPHRAQVRPTEDPPENMRSKPSGGGDVCFASGPPGSAGGGTVAPVNRTARPAPDGLPEPHHVMCFKLAFEVACAWVQTRGNDRLRIHHTLPRPMQHNGTKRPTRHNRTNSMFER